MCVSVCVCVYMLAFVRVWMWVCACVCISSVMLHNVHLILLWTSQVLVCVVVAVFNTSVVFNT